MILSNWVVQLPSLIVNQSMCQCCIAEPRPQYRVKS